MNKVESYVLEGKRKQPNRRSVMLEWLGASNFLIWEMTFFFIDQIGTGIALDEERRYLLKELLHEQNTANTVKIHYSKIWNKTLWF